MKTAVLPHMREKKRYLAFEVITDARPGFTSIRKSVQSSLLRYAGTKGASDAGAQLLRERYDENNLRGIIRVNHKQLDLLKASMCLIDNIDKKPAIIRSIGASGILKKAYEKYIQN